MVGERTSGAQLLIHVSDIINTPRNVGADGLCYREVVSQGSAEMSGPRQGSIALISVVFDGRATSRIHATLETRIAGSIFLRFFM